MAAGSCRDPPQSPGREEEHRGSVFWRLHVLMLPAALSPWAAACLLAGSLDPEGADVQTNPSQDVLP